ncbi:MAG: hypothetical protein CL933_26420 [Deltaproteobacteria bacterium]|nr:hypothetical protein [Deltaproteobacteria bacterium]
MNPAATLGCFLDLVAHGNLRSPGRGFRSSGQDDLRQLGVLRSTFYGWYGCYEMFAFDGLHDKKAALRPR